MRKLITLTSAAAWLLAVGCQEMKDNPRTTGTIGGAALGAGAGALIDHDEPARGALIGGAVGGVAGNVGGELYKQNRKDDDHDRHYHDRYHRDDGYYDDHGHWHYYRD